VTGIAVRGLTCTYRGAATPALAGLTCSVPAGTLTVVMGATGAGKTTLARCLTNIVPCFVPADVGGDVRLQGEPIAGRRVGELAGLIGMVFQDFEAQLFSSDVTQEIVFGLEQTGVPPAEMAPRMRDALAAVGLAGFEGRDPGTLSGGEKQRLSIAGLLALRPPILVLDEPTTDLDPAGRAGVFAVLAGLRRERLAVLLIEHDVGAAGWFCSATGRCSPRAARRPCSRTSGPAGAQAFARTTSAASSRRSASTTPRSTPARRPTGFGLPAWCQRRPPSRPCPARRPCCASRGWAIASPTAGRRSPT
jgi:energy-coupling factor transporter ATP-binding protein EcfA2